MFTILDTVADEALATARFACDLGACKGACCTVPGGRGAPLDDAEVQLIRDAIPAALPYLPERNRAVIETRGAVEGRPGDFATRCIDRRDCVFVYYEGDVAKCAIERAYFKKETPFRKPLSCHLFPIRIDQVFDADYLRYERISECQPAVENGTRRGVPLYKFLKEAIVRAYGEEYYRELVNRIEKRTGENR
ncbi:MAG: DUF3109 family protein [Bacteroidetes bacterium]|nr:DUF3109 family protein [Bacteroidota bacterium]